MVELAATRLIALHKNKGKSVAACLKSRTDYAQNPDKTQQGELVSSYECSPLTVDEEFMLSKRQYELMTGRRQKNDVIAYQIRQSFKPGEITAEEANKVGYELAMRFTKGKYGIRAEWKIYCIRSAYYIYKNYGSDIYQEALKIIVEAWWGDSDSFLSGILHGVTRFVAMYRDEYSRERLIMRLGSVHPKTITKNARKDTGNIADRHMKQILEIYNGSSRSLSLPVKR